MDKEDASIAMANNVLFPLIAGNLKHSIFMLLSSVFLLYLMNFFVALGLLTNGFVILVVLISEKSRTNRSVANIFVINLAVADILFLLALPFYTPMIHINGYAYSAAACKILEGKNVFLEVVNVINNHICQISVGLFNVTKCLLAERLCDSDIKVLHQLLTLGKSERTCVGRG